MRPRWKRSGSVLKALVATKAPSGPTEVLQTAAKPAHSRAMTTLPALEIETTACSPFETSWQSESACRVAKEFQNSIRKQRPELMLEVTQIATSTHCQVAANAAEADMASRHVDIMSKLYALSRRGILHFVFAAVVHLERQHYVHRAVPSLKGYHDLAGTKDLVRAHLTLMQHQQRANLSQLWASPSLTLCRPSCGLWDYPAHVVAAPNRRRCVRLGRAPVAAQGRAPAVVV
jgi:hypothetical protein